MDPQPPLNALRTFEVAARRGGFAAAARELGVTPAAVSLQVRNLEAWIGKTLFLRKGKGLELTDAGRALYPDTARALADLRSTCARLVESPPASRLLISAEPSLADAWLPSVLTRFRQTNPHTDIDIRLESDPIASALDAVDVRLAYGDYHYPDWQSFLLFRDSVTPMCAPDLHHSLGGGDDVLSRADARRLIHTRWGPAYGSNPGWSDWLQGESTGTRPEAISRAPGGLHVPTSSLALSLARQGMGIVLGQLKLASEDIAAGRLVRLSPRALPLGHGYFACAPDQRLRREVVQRLLALLRGGSGAHTVPGATARYSAP